MAATTAQTVGNLLTAVATRDLRRLEQMLAPTCAWQNMPHPPAAGRVQVIAMLAPILCWSDEVRWDVISAAYEGNTAWVERADRFWIDGEEHTVLCNGVITVDPDSGTVASVRDYVDLGEWRARLAPVFERLSARPAVEVVARHLRAVDRRDSIAMAADYALDAVLTRSTDAHRGWFRIADYFRTVPERLGATTLECSAPQLLPSGEVSVEWAISKDGTTTVTGTDIYRVERGCITHQAVGLHGPDF